MGKNRRGAEVLRFGWLRDDLQNRRGGSSSPLPRTTKENLDSFMNIYETTFFSSCPINHAQIRYELTIKTKDLIMVEDLLEEVRSLNDMLHEDIAEYLLDTFGGEQRLHAIHHGVVITTERSQK
jgi:hypothetical protein